jgi:SAM-dependent methyltransferase
MHVTMNVSLCLRGWGLFVVAAMAFLGADAAPRSIAASLDYSKPDYWESRYRKQTWPVEWYGLKWSFLKDHLEHVVKPEHRVIHLGSGSSSLPEQMLKDGYRNQIATDISGSVIRTMNRKHSDLAPELVFEVQDALNPKYPEASFDVVIEKGTLNALRVKRDCNLDQKGCEMSAQERGLILQAMRLLRPGGVFVAIADEMPARSALRAKGLECIEKVVLPTTAAQDKKIAWLLFKVGGPGGPRRQENTLVTAEGVVVV